MNTSCCNTCRQPRLRQWLPCNACQVRQSPLPCNRCQVQQVPLPCLNCQNIGQRYDSNYTPLAVGMQPGNVQSAAMQPRPINVQERERDRDRELLEGSFRRRERRERRDHRRERRDRHKGDCGCGGGHH